MIFHCVCVHAHVHACMYAHMCTSFGQTQATFIFENVFPKVLYMKKLQFIHKCFMLYLDRIQDLLHLSLQLYHRKSLVFNMEVPIPSKRSSSGIFSGQVVLGQVCLFVSSLTDLNDLL